ncbi:MAG: outer membrane beta-barrel protein [Mariprofundaceae bacterium]
MKGYKLKNSVIYSCLGLSMLALLLLPGTARSDGLYFDPYVGAGTGLFGLSTQTSSAKVLGGYVLFGVEINPYLAPEIRVGTAAGGSTSGFSKVRMDWFVSYLTRLQVAVNSDATLYGLFGATTMRTSLTPTTGTRQTDTTTDFTFGGGLDYQLGNGLQLGAEWVRYASRFDSAQKRRLNVWGISGVLKVPF